MTRTTRAEQLDLCLSMGASVDLQQDIARTEAYARDVADENARLTAANAKLEQHIAALKKDKQAWERSYKRLKTERDQIYEARLTDTEHPLHQECTQLREEVDSLRSKLYQRVWAELEGMRRQPVSIDKQALTRLLTLCHPDKWSHPEASALTLAHEVSVLVTKMRGEVQA